MVKNRKFKIAETNYYYWSDSATEEKITGNPFLSRDIAWALNDLV